MTGFRADYKEIVERLVAERSFRVGVASGVTATVAVVLVVWLAT